MPRSIAFLRAINVGGRNVAMAVLRAEFEKLGLREVSTFIASGNVLFSSGKKEAALTQQIEVHLRQSLGYDVDTFLRTEAELEAIVAHRPFPPAELAQAEALNVLLLKQSLCAEQIEMLQGLRTEIDDFHVHGREVYWLCRRKQSESKFSNAVFERKLKTRTTIRGLKMLARLVDGIASAPS